MPEVLVVGLGAYRRMTVSEDVRVELEWRGIEVIPLPTSDACRKYNQLRLVKRTAAGLHLTC